MAEETLYDSEAMRRFAGIELGDDRIPDGRKPEGHHPQLPASSGASRADRGDLRGRERAPCGQGHHAAIGDAGGCDDHRRAVFDASKNKAGARDPEMSSTKKGNTWYFGMKAHVGVDAESGVTHSLETSTAKVHDSRIWDELLHGGETSVRADKGYVSAAREAAFSDEGKVWGVMRKAPKGGKLHPEDEKINRIIAMVRARVEHPFRILKRQFGYVKTRYRGLAKNRAQLFTLFALGNLFLVRRRLMA
jgi:transposase, IS5 family